jgi:predicted nucleic acid-binding Zn ribbon protein
MKIAIEKLASPQSNVPSNPGWEKDGERQKKEREVGMLWTIIVILFILWLLGLVTAYTFGGLIHILLVIALIILIVRLLQGRRVL